MRALLLSVSAGSGHKHAAIAVKNYILEHEPSSNVEILDTLKYINPLLDKVIIGSYLKTIKITPSLFGKLYNFTEKDDGISSVTNKLSEIMSYKILPTIQDFKPDIIICTHPFSTQMVSILKQKNELDIPMICILTDYAPHNLWIHPGVDSYIVSNSDMVDEMVDRGVKRQLIFDFGIPVNPDFITRYNREETLKELSLDPYKKTLLIMGGSLGMGRIAHIYEQLSRISMNIQIIVITGNNKKLFSELQETKKNSIVATKILGYTKNVNKYMQCSDLLITKPGGLTITEALICHTPLALFSPIPGQEQKNEEFLIRHNLAISLEDGTNCKKDIEELISCPSKLETMKNNCIKFSKPSSGYNIYNLMHSLIRKRELAIMKNET